MVIRGTARRAPRPPALTATARDAQGFVTHTADDMAAPAPSPRNSARPPLQDQGSIRALRSPRGSFRGRPAELQAVPSVRLMRTCILSSLNFLIGFARCFFAVLF